MGRGSGVVWAVAEEGLKKEEKVIKEWMDAVLLALWLVVPVGGLVLVAVLVVRNWDRWPGWRRR